MRPFTPVFEIMPIMVSGVVFLVNLITKLSRDTTHVVNRCQRKLTSKLYSKLEVHYVSTGFIMELVRAIP